MRLSDEEREAVRISYGYRCGYCGVSEFHVGEVAELREIISQLTD